MGKHRQWQWKPVSQWWRGAHQTSRMASRRSSGKRSVGSEKLLSALQISSQLNYWSFFYSVLHLIKYRVISLPDTGPLRLSSYHYLDYRLDVNAWQLSALDDSNTNLVNKGRVVGKRFRIAYTTAAILTDGSGVGNAYLHVLWLVRQSFGLSGGSSSPLPQPAMGVVGWWRTFRCLGGWGLMPCGPLRADSDHGVSVISTLVLCWLQHYHTLRVLLTQSVQRNHCVLKTQQSSQRNADRQTDFQCKTDFFLSLVTVSNSTLGLVWGRTSGWWRGWKMGADPGGGM